MNLITRPMLAASIVDNPRKGKSYEGSIDQLRYPLIASPKIDGIRCLTRNGGMPYSREFKQIPNEQIRLAFASAFLLDNFDGELVLWNRELDRPEPYNSCQSFIMSENASVNWSRDNIVWYYLVFDYYLDERFDYRYKHLLLFHQPPWISVVKSVIINNQTELETYEQECIAVGYEGVMLRSPCSPYKFGRSTFKEQYLIKLKRFEESEATIIGFKELQFNDNPSTKNAFGLRERSSHKHNQNASGMLGALVVRDTKTGIEFDIGSGFSREQRVDYWHGMNRYLIENTTIKYKYQKSGMKDKPRHPIFLGFK